MAGTALSAGVLLVAASLSLGLAAVGGAAVTAQRTTSAADAAALA
ncbi:MAG TPA: helicase, partial [Microbacterium sp.]|nr:helicase [Microbacterium sp.]